jgi:hypothetical protein
MGGLWLETPAGDIYQVSWYAQSDTKWLLEILMDAPFLPTCARVFRLDLQPLAKIETDWANFDMGEVIWQDPQILIECVQSLVAAFTTTPQVYALLEAERQRQGIDFLDLSGFEDEEMSSGFIIDELSGIAEAAKEAQQKGALQVKLCGS